MYVSDSYSLRYQTLREKIRINMQIHNNIVNTSLLPHTYDFLSVRLPQVLSTECYNDGNIPFKIEVKNTEMGHLFEHILLEYLCIKKMSHGFESAEFSGRTNWNWIEEPYGSFNINVEIKKNDIKFFKDSLLETIKIFDLLLKTR